MAKQIINNREFQIYSCYNLNVSKELVNAQKSVFNIFNMNLTQELTNLQHPEWLDKKINDLKNFDIIVFFDIDVIPLKPNLYNYILEQIGDDNSIIGIEQAANHLDPNFVYAGPACFAFSKKTYEKLKKPSFMHNYRADTAGEFTFSAKKYGVNVKFFNIISSLTNQWKCKSKFFGFGTTYDDWIYHQFGSSLILSNMQFINKTNQVLKMYRQIENFL